MASETLHRLSPAFKRLFEGRAAVDPAGETASGPVAPVLLWIRSEQLLMEKREHNLLFRWLVGLNMDDPIWDATVDSKNRDRLRAGDIARQFQIVAEARERGLTSHEHFSVDGTLIEARASQKSFKRKDGSDDGDGDSSGRNPHVDFRGEPRRNGTHYSTTGPEARLYRKAPSQEAKLSYFSHIVIENRHGVVVGCEVTEALGQHMEREAAARSWRTLRASATVGADRAFDAARVCSGHARAGSRRTSHRTPPKRRSAIGGRTTWHSGYSVSQVARKLVENPFGWIKAVAGLWQFKHRGRAKVEWTMTIAITAYNLIRLRNVLVTA